MIIHRLGIMIPTDELIFFRGVGQPPTRRVWQTVPVQYSPFFFPTMEFWWNVFSRIDWREDSQQSLSFPGLKPCFPVNKSLQKNLLIYPVVNGVNSSELRIDFLKHLLVSISMTWGSAVPVNYCKRLYYYCIYIYIYTYIYIHIYIYTHNYIYLYR